MKSTASGKEYLFCCRIFATACKHRKYWYHSRRKYSTFTSFITRYIRISKSASNKNVIYNYNLPVRPIIVASRNANMYRTADVPQPSGTKISCQSSSVTFKIHQKYEYEIYSTA